METNKEISELRSDEAFAELLSKSPPRPVPPAADEASIRKSVHAEWARVAGRRVRRRRTTTVALAASVLLAVVATFNLIRDPLTEITGLQMAAVDKQFGGVSVNSHTVDNGLLAAIQGGDVVQTGSDSGLALSWHDGGSLRIDEDTAVVFEAAERIYLREGRVYFDSISDPLSSAKQGAASLEIRTDHGFVRHLGTQYMTAVGDDKLIVSVREGVVSIEGNVTARASAGQRFAISRSGELSIDDTNGVDDWEWVEKSTPAIDLDGRTVSQALDWVSRESGRSIQYASEDARRVANESILVHLVLPPTSRALETVMMTVDLKAHIEGDVIVISED